MNALTLLRWSAYAGLISAIGVPVFTAAFFAGLNEPIFVNTRQIATLFLAQLGLLGIYAVQSERTGRLSFRADGLVALGDIRDD